ncbi:MAG: hypothetical protein ACFFEU_14405 [Candidatus Thorarchaeota archaeon]
MEFISPEIGAAGAALGAAAGFDGAAVVAGGFGGGAVVFGAGFGGGAASAFGVDASAAGAFGLGFGGAVGGAFSPGLRTRVAAVVPSKAVKNVGGSSPSSTALTLKWKPYSVLRLVATLAPMNFLLIPA